MYCRYSSVRATLNIVDGAGIAVFRVPRMGRVTSVTATRLTPDPINGLMLLFAANIYDPPAETAGIDLAAWGFGAMSVPLTPWPNFTSDARDSRMFYLAAHEGTETGSDDAISIYFVSDQPTATVEIYLGIEAPG